MICTFFGHRDASSEISTILYDTLVDLIENNEVKFFYVGYNGKFDNIVFKQLKRLSEIYPIKYKVVLAYIPKANKYPSEVITESILPDGIEKVPEKFAISYRNRWMIQKSDIVVTYITRSFGGAAQFRDLAIKKGKKVIDIYKEKP